VTDLKNAGSAKLRAFAEGNSAVASSNGAWMIQFGIFEADLRAGELRRKGSKVRLQEQPFQILAMLLERPGEIVTREELRTHLWPADTFVDFDHSLNAAVRRLRDALGDIAENPRFVETVARRGYRFLPPVNGIGHAAVSEIAISSDKQVQTPTHRGLIAGAAVVLLLAGLVVGLIVGRRGSSSSSPASPVTGRRLTANPDEDPVNSAAISPDGKYLAFSDDTGSYLRQIDTGETHPLALPGGFKAKPVSWFPDGSHILATSVEGPAQEPGLWRLSGLGGSPRKLSDDARDAAVSPDGSQIVFLRGAINSQELWLMGAGGEQPRKLSGETGDLFRSPVWSPDGKHMAFLRGVHRPGTYGVQPQIEILDLASNQRFVVLAQPRLGPALAWIGDRLVYVLNETPPNQNDSNIWSMKIDLGTGKPLGGANRITSSPGAIEYLSNAANGKRLAYVKQGWQPDVYVAKVEANGARLSTPRRLTLDERQDLPWSWTPDSKQVLFGSDRDGSFHLFRQAPDQTTPELLVGGTEELMLPRLTPDGTQIVYLQYHRAYDWSDVVRMMRIPVAGGPPQFVLETRGLTNEQCARLPSTLCLYSVSEDKRLVFMSFDPLNGKGQEVAHIDDDLPYSFNWTLSRDGLTLAIAKANKLDILTQPVIRLLTLKGGKERSIFLKDWSSINSLDWTADGKGLWVSASTNTGINAVLNVDLQGRARPVWEQTKMYVGWAIPSPDGRQIALLQASGNSNVWMVENF
jgi:Tol biopolymer transport system component/DNA-binding winged helix-turn-helix (wHTH) protein